MKSLLLVLIAVFVAVPASAQVGVGLRIGTLGPGLEVGYAISPRLSVRAAGSYLPLSRSDEADKEVRVAVDGDVTVGAVGAMVDFHPFANAVRLTAGLTVNLFDVQADVVPLEPYCMGNGDATNCDGKLFAPERLGTVGAQVGYASKIAPYVGLGLGRVAGTSRIGFLFDVGTLYAGSPEVDLQGSGMLAPTASEEQEATINTGVESFQWIPVVSVGIAVRL